MNKFSNIKWIPIVITYTTSYDSLLKEIYSPLYSIFFKHVIGYNELFEIAKKTIIQNNLSYDFILTLRIDLLLKQEFMNRFNPNWSTIRYPFICWTKDSHTKNNYPRISDTMVFIPKKYFISSISLNHESWEELCQRGFGYSDIDVMIETYHDSDSSKDYNPLYTIVNRNKNDTWHSPNQRFDKKQQFMQSHKLFLVVGPNQHIISPYW